MEQKYTAFISYRHTPADSAVAKALHTGIEQYTIPKGLRRSAQKKLGKVFRDLEELPASSNLTEDIYRALDNAENLIVICSREMTQSPWVAREVAYFLEHHPQEKVYTVLVDGEPGEVFPQALLHKQLPDGRVEAVEPLAVDVRAADRAGTLKKVKRELPRLLAAMIGCPYDALIQRQQKRQRRRLLLGASAVLAVALLFSGVMLVKNRQIQQTNEQLELTNQQLQEQKTELQLRESALLVGQAQQHLQAGELGLALPYAVQALEGERPYYAPAEQALIASLGVLDDTVQQLLVDKQLFQMSPVKDLRLSNCGKYAATIDPYGTIYGYDIATEAVLWSMQAPQDAAITGSRRLLVMGSDRIVAVDFATGACLWEQPIQSAGLYGTALDRQEERLAAVAVYYNEELTRERYLLLQLDTQTGQLLQQLELTQGQSLLAAQSYPNVQMTTVACLEGDTFVCGWVLSEDPENAALQLCLADLSAGSTRLVCSLPVERYTSQTNLYQLRLEQDRLLVLRGSKEAMAQLDCYSLSTDQLLWQSSCARAEGNSLYGTPLLAATERYCAVACEKWLFLVDRETGTALPEATTEVPVTRLEGMDSGIFAIARQDGRIGYFWPNAAGSLSWNLPAKLEAHHTILLYDEGFLRAPVEAGRVQVTATGTGYSACISQEDPRYVYISRAVQLSDRFAPTQVAYLQPQERMYNSRLWKLEDGRLVLGPVDLDSEQPPYYRFVVLDPSQPQALQSLYAGSEYADPEELFFNHPGSGCLECGSSGDILWFDTATGREQVLSERQTLELGTLADTQYVTSRCISAGATRSADGVTLAVRLEEQGLTLWLDGQEQTVPAPEGLRLQLQDQGQLHRALWVGANGWVVCPGFDQTQYQALLCYNTLTGQWSRLSVEQPSQVLVGADTDRALLIGQDDQVLVYDLRSAQQLGQYGLMMSREALDQAQLVMDDTVLLVKTRDKQLLCREAQTGQVFYQTDTQSIYPVQFDRDRDGRVYLGWGNGGVCLQTGRDSWELLTQVPDLLGFDPGSRQLVCTGYNESFDQVLQLRSIPDTQQLLQIAKQLLEG